MNKFASLLLATAIISSSALAVNSSFKNYDSCARYYKNNKQENLIEEQCAGLPAASVGVLNVTYQAPTLFR